ncbi:ABC transporter ATP-binding protein [Geodermatophilus sp. URMC 63]
MDDLRVSFPVRGRGWARDRRVVRAVDGVSFTLDRGETLALVGESGSGKSTTARAVLRLVPKSGGSVTFEGVDLESLSRRELRAKRRDMQMVFQDPYSSLDPSMTVGDSVGIPLQLHQKLTGREKERRIEELFDLVRLSSHQIHRYPHEFSGGQRQRIAIARALATNPKLIVCDEAVSALDMSTQNQVLNLLKDLRDELGLSYLFIAHDLAVVRHIAQRTAVMYLGRIVEIGPTERVYNQPEHPYTKALLSAIPQPDPTLARRNDRVLLRGDPPDPSAPPAGCPFHTRCGFAMDKCASDVPAITRVEGGGTVACHLHTPSTGALQLTHAHGGPR